MRWLTLTVVGLLALPYPGWAGTFEMPVGTTSTNRTLSASSGANAAYKFTAADSTHYFGPIYLSAPENIIQFDADTGGTPVGTATVVPYWCPDRTITICDATTILTCDSQGGMNGNASLDGTQGEPSTQNARKWVGSGLYCFHINAACGAGDLCQLNFKAN